MVVGAVYDLASGKVILWRSLIRACERSGADTIERLSEYGQEIPSH